jgi:hypothetical protein
MNINSNDTKAFLVGMFASMAAVIAWDLVKSSLKILNYQEKQK